ncbi:MAG: chemoreceptor glutamine deamidase CheD [Gammaproteobacteria bacterium]|nr:MAG: chemoreceptor glutamine deamidase CheD [Gammaproteobacteria bacterium]
MQKNKIKYIFGRHVIEPGGFYFGKEEEDIYTLLGSCVAVTMWHPILHIAGMCHVVLPGGGGEKTNTRFAGCAIKKFLQEIKRFNTLPLDYEVGVYGGGNMFPLQTNDSKNLIGVKNFTELEKLLFSAGFIIKFKDVGGDVARKLTLNRITGFVSLEHVILDK